MPPDPHHRNHHRRGSAVGAALVIALAVTLILASLMRLSHLEQLSARRHVSLTKARMTAESVAQYGAAHIKARLERITYFRDDEFRPGNYPPQLPSPSLLNGILALPPGGSGIGIGGLVSDLAQSGQDALGGIIGGGASHTGNSPGSGNSNNSNNNNSGSVSDAAQDSGSGYFRYEITPENLVVGRFGPARWEKAEATNPLYTGDPLIDQTVRVREVRMVAAAKSVDVVRRTATTAYCEQYLQVRDSPVWGNMLFYNMDLEIAPGPSMEIHGPVHTNGNLYVQSDASLQFHASVTAAGHLYHGRAPGGGSTSNGAVSFKKQGTDRFVRLDQNGAWLDSRAEDWVNRASTLWAGHVRTREHGINPAMPAAIAPYVPDDPATGTNELANDAHVVIEPARRASAPSFPGTEVEVQKFASKACLVLETKADGSVELYKYRASSSGDYVRETSTGPRKFQRERLNVPPGLIVGDRVAQKFYDVRRARDVRSLDVDIGELRALIEQPGRAAAFTRDGVAFDPASDWNGIVYVAHAQPTEGGVRLVNGSRIPNRPTEANGYTKGFTIATNAPAYVWGHYNADGHIADDGDAIRSPDSADEPPAGIAADAVTILSSAWADEEGHLALSNRIAQQTEVSAAILSGLVPTNKNGNRTYSGGVENLPRFLEDWSNVKFGYRGSIAVLYESESATQPWGASNVYSPPKRVWGFNTLFAEGVLPPGTPNSRTYRRVGFRDLSAAEYQDALTVIDNE